MVRLVVAGQRSGRRTAPIRSGGAARPLRSVCRLARAAIAGGIAAGGLVAVFAYHQAKLGAWDAFLRVQAKYDHGIVSPLSRIVAQAQRRDVLAAAGTETVVVAAALAALAIFCVWRGLRGRDLLLLGCGAVFWLFPLSFANVELTRSEALVLPALVLLDDAPLAAGACAFVAFAMLAWPIAQLFYRGVMV